MEDGTVGKHCDFEGCNQKEYFAFRCDDCNKHFCADHRHVTCEMTKVNPDAPLIETVEEVKQPCGLAASDGCEEDGIAHCSLCDQDFCLQHRFEDQHNCAHLREQELEEQKTAAKHQSLQDKIKQKSLAQQEQRQAAAAQAAAQAALNNPTQKQASPADLTPAQLKKLQTAQKVQRIKAKSAAKGDQGVTRDQRFAFTLTFEQALASESSSVDPAKPSVQFFDKRMSVGQVIDSLCRQYYLTSCIDFDNVELSQLYIYGVKIDSSKVLFDHGSKVAELPSLFDWFEQGDSVLVRRGKL